MKIQLQKTELTVQAILLAAALLFGLSIKAQYNYLGTYNSQGKPNYLVSPGDVVSQQFLDDVDASLPEGKPVPTYNPQYISTGTETDICLKDSADVWVTFVAEGAGYRNVLGFYSYDLANPPQTKADIKNETIIFPNVSARWSGGELDAGDKVKIGTFSKNTGIGWFLVANGWNGSGVGNGNWKVYSNPNFNPEANAIDRNHNVLLNDSSNQRIVLGFEDIRRDYSSCDQDFNDAIFYITANPYSAIQTDSINTISDASTTVSSGGNGGLESNGSLASKIAQRNFQRKKTKTVDYNAFETLPIFNVKSIQLGTVTSYKREKSIDQRLHELLPTESLFKSKAVVTTPNDLLGITNAKEVFAADYISGNNRKGAAMIMYTENGVYEHTKAVCDRLNGAELLSIQSVKINDYPFTLFKLKQANGAIEYAVNFVIREDIDGNLIVDNHWALSEYKVAAKNYNFQLWSSTVAMTIQLVQDALSKTEPRGNLIYENKNSDLPQVYIKKGEYQNGKLILSIQNNTAVKQLELTGNISRTESNLREEIQKTIVLTGAKVQQVEVEVGLLFDIGFKLENGSSVSDVLYTADGAWGTDYEIKGARLNSFDIFESTVSNNNCYPLERGIASSGEVSSYVSFFKNLKAGGRATDVSMHNALQFEGASNQEVEITLVKESISEWSKQFKAKVKFDSEAKKQLVYLADFKSTSGEKLKVDDVQSVVFSIKSDGKQTKSYEIELNQLAFVNAEKPKTLTKNELFVYPNPINENTVISYNSLSEGVAVLSLRSYDGKVLSSRSINIELGLNKISANFNSLSKGIYFYLLEFKTNTYFNKVVVQ